MKALYPPANFERVHPDKMPTDPQRFKSWADIACTEWPADLMVASYNAWMNETHWGICAPGAIEMFRREYRKWFYLSEDEKEALMQICQRESPRRRRNRLDAARIPYRPVSGQVNDFKGRVSHRDGGETQETVWQRR